MNRFPRLLLVLCLLFPLGIQADDNPDRIFVFGDSLSDTGNLAAFIDVNFPMDSPFPGPHPIGTIGLCNPIDIIREIGCKDIFYEASRVSNGPVAVEVMAERLGQDTLEPSLYFLRLPTEPGVTETEPGGSETEPAGTNYAVAGALAGGGGLGDLGTQVRVFLADYPMDENPPPDDALYVIIIGGNDVIDAVQAALDLLRGKVLDEDEKPEAIVDAAIDAIEANADALINRGAGRILVGNVPNIGALPAVRNAAPAGSEALVTGLATAITLEFNRKLAQRLDRIRARHADESVKIREFNVFGYFETVRFLAKLFGWNAVDACFNTEKYRESAIAEREFHPDCKPAMPGEPARYNKFVFFDDIHPTGWVHAAIGRAMARAARRLLDD